MCLNCIETENNTVCINCTETETNTVCINCTKTESNTVCINCTETESNTACINCTESETNTVHKLKRMFCCPHGPQSPQTGLSADFRFHSAPCKYKHITPYVHVSWMGGEYIYHNADVHWKH